LTEREKAALRESLKGGMSPEEWEAFQQKSPEDQDLDLLIYGNRNNWF
jgi:hypothetical protein